MIRAEDWKTAFWIGRTAAQEQTRHMAETGIPAYGYRANVPPPGHFHSGYEIELAEGVSNVNNPRRAVYCSTRKHRDGEPRLFIRLNGRNVAMAPGSWEAIQHTARKP